MFMSKETWVYNKKDDEGLDDSEGNDISDDSDGKE